LNGGGRRGQRGALNGGRRRLGAVAAALGRRRRSVGRAPTHRGTARRGGGRARQRGADRQRRCGPSREERRGEGGGERRCGGHRDAGAVGRKRKRKEKGRLTVLNTKFSAAMEEAAENNIIFGGCVRSRRKLRYFRQPLSWPPKIMLFSAAYTRPPKISRYFRLPSLSHRK
jgi:hypothetical protein